MLRSFPLLISVIRFFATAITRVADRKKPTPFKKWSCKKIMEESDLDSPSESICSFHSEICLASKDVHTDSYYSPLLKFLRRID